jgi:hypothetical protein
MKEVIYERGTFNYLLMNLIKIVKLKTKHAKLVTQLFSFFIIINNKK